VETCSRLAVADDTVPVAFDAPVGVSSVWTTLLHSPLSMPIQASSDCIAKGVRQARALGMIHHNANLVIPPSSSVLGVSPGELARILAPLHNEEIVCGIKGVGSDNLSINPRDRPKNRCDVRRFGVSDRS
jgi:hypothetical protein